MQPFYQWSLLVFTLVASFTQTSEARSRVWQAHQDGVWKLEYSPQGKYLLSAGGDGEVKVWRAGDFQLVSTFKHDTDFKVYDAAFLDEKRVLSTSHDGSIYIWDRQTGEKLHKVMGHRLYSARVAVSPEGSRFYTLGSDNRIIEWDSENYKETSRLVVRSPVGLVIQSNKNEWITAGLAGIQSWESREKKLVKTYDSSPYFFTLSEFDANSFLAAGNIAQKAGFKRLQIQSGKILSDYVGASGFIWQIASSLNRKWVGASSFKGPVLVWNTRTAKQVYTSVNLVGESISLAFVPHRRAIVIGDFEGKIHAVNF